MTPNQILTKAKKRVRTNTVNLDWSGFFDDSIDEIFSAKPWRFARKEINYIHPQNTFEYEFNNTVDELALNHLVSAYYATSFIGGIPVTGSCRSLDYTPYGEFNYYNPDHTLVGYPELITNIRDNDGAGVIGTGGMQIGLFRCPVADISVWIYGDFIPAYTINDNQLTILPTQFHRLMVDLIVHYAAMENGQDKLSDKSYARYVKGLAQLDEWDRVNPIYKPVFQPYDTSNPRKGPRFPDNYSAR